MSCGRCGATRVQCAVVPVRTWRRLPNNGGSVLTRGNLLLPRGDARLCVGGGGLDAATHLYMRDNSASA